MAARYTEDSIRVTGFGDTLVGRTTIEAWYKKAMQSCENDEAKLDRVKIISDDVIVAFGFWSATCHSDKGLVRLGGHWMYTEVRNANGWKAAASLTNNVPQKWLPRPGLKM
jgi:ketosteroid isomerase-like protein